MDSIINTLDISVVIGILLGGFLATALLGLVLLFNKGQKKVSVLSSIIIAFCASFLSIQSSLFIGEWRLSKMADRPMEIADMIVRNAGKVSSGLNVGVFIANLFPGVNIPEVPEVNPELVTQLKEEIDSHKKRHLYYILIGLLGFGVTVHVSLETEGGSRSNSKRRNQLRSEFFNE